MKETYDIAKTCEEVVVQLTGMAKIQFKRNLWKL